MVNPEASTQPKPKFVVGPKSSPGGVSTMPDAVASRDMIRTRAYELYEIRGREPGQDEQDWLRAEQQILRQER
jgi:hypothetical protein